MSQQLLTAEAQLQQAKSTLQSMSGGRGMQTLLSGTNRNYLPTSSAQLTSAMQGNGSYPGLTLDVRNAVNANAVLTPTQLAALSPADQQQITAARQVGRLAAGARPGGARQLERPICSLAELDLRDRHCHRPEGNSRLAGEDHRRARDVAERANEAPGALAGRRRPHRRECAAKPRAVDRRAGPVRAPAFSRRPDGHGLLRHILELAQRTAWPPTSATTRRGSRRRSSRPW